MRKLTLFISILALLLCYTGCSKDEEKENDAVVDTYLEIAQKYLDNGQPDLAISILEDALEECGENEDLAELLEEALLQKASAIDQDSTAATEATAPATEAPTETTAPPTAATTPPTAATAQPTGAPAVDYSAWSGTWASNSNCWYDGGTCLELSVSGTTMFLEFNCIQSAPMNRIATVTSTQDVSSISDNKLFIYYSNDGWGNAGCITVDFSQPNVISCYFSETYTSPTAGWGFDTYSANLTRQ